MYRGTQLSARLPSGWKVLNATRNSLDLTTAAGDALVVFYRVSHARGNGGYSPDAFRDMALSQSGVPFEDTALTEQGFSHATVHHLRSLGTVGMEDDTQWQFQETRLRARWQGHPAILRTRVAIHNEYQGTYSAVLSLIAAREDRWAARKSQLEAVERTIAPRAVHAPEDLPRDNPLTDGHSAFWAAALPGRSLCGS